MKRDLQIAKEIQAWLLPANPPHVPGMEIAFFTRPANTVAGDYYDVFYVPPSNVSSGTFLIAVADVAGKSVPAAMLDGYAFRPVWNLDTCHQLRVH